MGILMTRQLVTQEQAFELLRGASQHGHRKLAGVAQDVITAGDLQYPMPRRAGRSRTARPPGR